MAGGRERGSGLERKSEREWLPAALGGGGGNVSKVTSFLFKRNNCILTDRSCDRKEIGLGFLKFSQSFQSTGLPAFYRSPELAVLS